MPEEINKKNKPLESARVRELIPEVMKGWRLFLPPSFLITLEENEMFWKLVAKDNTGYRRSAFLKKNKTLEVRVIDAIKGLMTDYFLDKDIMPSKWGEA